MLKNLALHNVCLAIRASDPKALQEGFDERFDNAVLSATYKLVNPEWFDEQVTLEWKQKPFEENPEELSKIIDQYSADAERINKMIKSASGFPNAKKWLCIYLQVQLYIQKGLAHVGDDKERHYWERRLEETCPESTVFESRDIERKISEAKKYMKSMRYELSDREAIKVSLSVKNIGSIITLISSLSFISGFIYSYFYYGFFDIPISIYFTASDYIASSIESIFPVFIIIFISLIFMFAGTHRASRKSMLQTEYDLKKPDFFKYSVILSILFFISIGLLAGGYGLHNAVSLTIIFYGFLIVPKISKHYFKNYTQGKFALIMAFVLCSHLYRTIYSDIYDILEQKSVSTLCDQLVIKPGIIKNDIGCGAIVLGATSDYVFIFDSSTNKAHSVPKESILLGKHSTDLFKYNLLERLSNWLRKNVIDLRKVEK